MQEIDLNAPGMRKQVAKEVLADIDAYCVTTYNDGFRNHLGASVIGHTCERYLFYVFRWGMEIVKSGRMYRLFNRGHREEHRFVEYLRGSGYIVHQYDPEVLHWHPESDSYFVERTYRPGPNGEVADVTEDAGHVELARRQGVELKRKQIRVSLINGHYGGSTDGVVYLPPRYNYSKPLLAEYKTNGTGAGFTSLFDKGVSLSKPQHFDQMNVYGSYLKIEYALYLNTNKNDDDIYPEIVKLDWKRGEDLTRKAEKVIMMTEAPRRISDSPQYMTCSTCDYKPVCHDGKALAKNCRSCRFSSPIEDAQWRCNKWGATIPTRAAILAGCDSWSAIA